ncbi:MAG: SUMF1/EgtB/PvdO family nonheme iron enzyme [Alphaproteobacteria bacterium]|nr:SUMF1/EgtB/PvdO family nonheme iron enzyme [Alphaproteobacteria bacterium]
MLLARGDSDDLVTVALRLAKALGAPTGGSYRRWLSVTAGALRVQDPRYIEAITGLGLPIATLNYDGLLEEATGMKPLTWYDGPAVERWLKREETGILHLNGLWRQPRTVALGIRDYEDILRDARAQALMYRLIATKTLVFVDCEGSNEDPNLGALLDWLQRYAGVVEHLPLSILGLNERQESSGRRFEAGPGELATSPSAPLPSGPLGVRGASADQSVTMPTTSGTSKDALQEEPPLAPSVDLLRDVLSSAADYRLVQVADKLGLELADAPGGNASPAERVEWLLVAAGAGYGQTAQIADAMCDTGMVVPWGPSVALPEATASGEGETCRPLQPLTGDLASPSPKVVAFREQHTQALKTAYAERRALLKEETPVPETLRERILHHKRALREGPVLTPGEYLGDGRYQLRERLGKGSFASVWKAWDEEGERFVAVKVLHGQHSSERSRRDRFFKGAQRMATLRHPGIVEVLDPGGEDHGFCWFAMELVPGGDLYRAVLEGRVQAAHTLPIVQALADALSCAHGADLVHRDVKPQNVLLTEDGVPKLTDFDLVKAAGSTDGTRTNVGMGTFGFAAPELMLDAKDADARADVYGLAMTALFLLCGRALPADVMLRLGPFVEEQEFSKEVEEVLLKGLAFAREQRYASAGAFVEALAGAVLASKVVDQPPEPEPIIDETPVPEPLDLGPVGEPPGGEVVKPSMPGDDSSVEDADTEEVSGLAQEPLNGDQLEPFMPDVVPSLEDADTGEAGGLALEPVELGRTAESPPESPAAFRVESPAARSSTRSRWLLLALVAVGLGWLGWSFVDGGTGLGVTPPMLDAPSCRELLSDPTFQRPPDLTGPLGAIGDDPIGRATDVDCLALSDTDHPLGFVGLSAGEVTMGSPTTEDGHYDKEGPQHRVRVPAFFAGQTEVTQGQWASVAGTEAGRKHGVPENPSFFTDDPRLPVEQVTWCDALRFAAALSELDGLEPFYGVEEDCESTGAIRQVSTQGYRLPTEAEWEYLARAGSTTRYWSGDAEDDLAAVGWYSGNSGQRTHPVAAPPTNRGAEHPWGLFDVHGNVWEWTLDPWIDHFRGREDGVTFDPVDLRYEDLAGNPANLADPTAHRVVRGGSWFYTARDARSAFRNDWNPGFRFRHLGFRLVLSAAPEP